MVEVPLKDMEVGTADPDTAHAQERLVGPWHRLGSRSRRESPHAFVVGRSHRAPPLAKLAPCGRRRILARGMGPPKPRADGGGKIEWYVGGGAPRARRFPRRRA